MTGRSSTGLADALKAEAARLGLAAAGITRLRPSEHADFFRRWLADGHHGEMAWLARPDTVDRRADPAAAWPDLLSALIVADRYVRSPAERTADASRGIIARYARGPDYHKPLKRKLLALLRWIESETNQDMPRARAYVDTGPVLERELARRAGLGWFGRNTMLIHPRRGSYFFLGCLLLPLDLEVDAPFEADHCGTCNACVEACPTHALLGRNAEGAPVLDARRCISYLTIEHRGPIPEELRPLMANRVFGCDICQEVCPWNREGGGEGEGEGEGGSGGGGEGGGLVELMGMSGGEWEVYSRGSAVRRAKRGGFLRNITVALGNWGSPGALPALRAALEDPDPLVRSHAAHALAGIESAAGTPDPPAPIASE